MSSLRRVLSSRANGRRSRGPVTEAGKRRSSANAISHGLLARCTLLKDESGEALDALFGAYLERLGPADAVELGYVEEMVAAHWRLRRLWAIETRTMDNEVEAADEGDPLDRIAAAYGSLARKPTAALLHRYEMRLHLLHQRALHNLLLLRHVMPNEPSPISGHLEEPASRPGDGVE